MLITWLSRSWSRPRPALVLAVLLAAVLWGAHWFSGTFRVFPDSYWYVQQSLRFAGRPADRAVAEAQRYFCAVRERSLTPGWIDTQKNGERPPAYRDRVRSCLTYVRKELQERPARYREIFTARPGYPLVAALFVAALGPRGLVPATALLGVVCGLLVFLAVRALGAGPGRALAAEALFYALPTGYWVSRLLSEGSTLAGILLALLGVTLAVRRAGHRRAHLAGAGVLAAGLAWTYASKFANGQALALTLAAAAAALVVADRDRRVAHGGVLVVAVAAAVGWLALSAKLGLPGLDHSLQDTFADHFRRPEVPDPWRRLAEQSLLFWPAWAGHLVDMGWVPVAVAAGSGGLLLRYGRAGLYWLAAGLSGLLLVAFHPLISEAARLAVTVWLPVAVGLVESFRWPARTGQERR